jgi:hypothetical protein
MKISEVPNSIIIKNCNAYEEDSDLIEVYKDSAKAYIKGYTGLSDEELDKYEDLTTAYLCIIGDMYDNRSFTVDSDKNNRMLQSIMDMHCINLL